MRQVMKEEMIRALVYAITVGLIVGMVIYLFSGCAHSSTGVRAVEITSPVGVNCYAIYDEAGKAVGGNCLWIR